MSAAQQGAEPHPNGAQRQQDGVYVGEELESFALAVNWKSYVRTALHPWLAGRVAEVGAGIGETTKALRPDAPVASWVCIEPDPEMAAGLTRDAASGALGKAVSAHCGTLATLASDERFDTIIYVDVLEHIEHDAAELAEAARRLAPGGQIVVLSPAYPYLYSEFDRAIGHWRRYTTAMLRKIAPPGLTERSARYYDCVGMLASAANKLLLKQKLPTVAQVRTWDRFMVPVSRVIDPLFRFAFGRSVVIVWQAP